MVNVIEPASVMVLPTICTLTRYVHLHFAWVTRHSSDRVVYLSTGNSIAVTVFNLNSRPACPLPLKVGVVSSVMSLVGECRADRPDYR